MNSFDFIGNSPQNFNRIARYLTEEDARILNIDSLTADISDLGANSDIRNFTVFMRSNTANCEVIIPDPGVFKYSVIGKKDTLFFFKGLAGSFTKTISVISGTVEGATSITLNNDQSFCIQSDGTEYKVLFNSNGGTGAGSAPEIILINDESTKSIPWTGQRALNFGDFPHTEVWIFDITDNLYHKAAEQPSIVDAVPPLFTTMSWDFGGNVTGFIVIK